MSDEPQDQPLAPVESPLVEADPNSINTLIAGRIDDIFNKPPLLLSDEDLRFTVEYYRRERARFMTESAAKEAKPRVAGKRRAVPKSVAEAIQSSVDLLG